MKALTEIHVDWADLDLFGHVNNVAYFRYVQAARVMFCESLGLSALNEPGRPGFTVASSQCQFRAAIYYPDTLTISVKVAAVKNTSFQLDYILHNTAGNTVAEASDVLVVYDHTQKCKLPIEPALRERLLSGL